MISINISELIWTVINFFLLLFVLKHFLYDPITKFMEERQARIDAGLEEERKAKETVRENRYRLAAEKAESRREAGQLINQAGAEDERRSEEARAAARGQAEADYQAGRAQLDAQREREETELAAHGQELSALLAARFLGQEEQ